MTLPPSLDRLPAVIGQRRQQVADAAGLVIGRRAMVGAAIDELLVLGADPPSVARLLALREGGEQVVAALDRAVACCRCRCGVVMPRPLARRRGRRQSVSTSYRFACGMTSRPPPPSTALIAASAAVSARRMRGPSEIARACGKRADRGALLVGEAAFGADQDRGRARRAARQAARRRLRRRRRACGPPASRAAARRASPARRARAARCARIARPPRSRGRAAARG